MFLQNQLDFPDLLQAYVVFKVQRNFYFRVNMVVAGIERAKKYQDIARTKVLNGDMPLYKLDILVVKVKEQLKSEGL